MAIVIGEHFEEIPNATFKDVCTLLGGEYRAEADREHCYIERGAKSGTKLMYYPKTKVLKVASIGVGPYTPRVRGGWLGDVDIDTFKTSGSFYCTIKYQEFPEIEMFFEGEPVAYEVECRSGEFHVRATLSGNRAKLYIGGGISPIREYKYHGNYALKLLRAAKEAFGVTPPNKDKEGFEVVE